MNKWIVETKNCYGTRHIIVEASNPVEAITVATNCVTMPLQYDEISVKYVHEEILSKE